MTHPARIVLADDEQLFRAALRSALDDEPGLSVVAQAGSAEQAMTQIVELQVHLALIATSLHDVPVQQLCASVKAQSPQCKVLVLDDEPRHETLVASLRSGADGYLTRDVAFSHLVECIHALLAGQAWVPPAMLSGLLFELIQRRREEDAGLRRFERLSRREREVLAALASGKDAAQTAAELAISTQTARTHIQNVLSKLEVHSRVEAASFAFEPAIHERLTVD
jgi:DNA-binding NarL/FixJ family response regulator